MSDLHLDRNNALLQDLIAEQKATTAQLHSLETGLSNRLAALEKYLTALTSEITRASTAMEQANALAGQANALAERSLYRKVVGK